MFRKVRFECMKCGDGFVDWHDDEWERTPVYCVHCGEAIVAGEAIDLEETTEPSAARGPDPSARALGVLKSARGEFRDTIPGLRIAPSGDAESEAPESSRDTQPGVRQLARRQASNANSSAPGHSTRPPALGPSRRFAPLAALLIGFAAGIPIALLTEGPVSRWLDPQAYARAELTQQLTDVSTAIDQGNLDRARSLLERVRGLSAESERNGLVHFDARVATLRARLALGMILADRSDEVSREIAALQNVPGARPSGDDVRRLFEALQPAKPSAVAAPVAPAKSVEKPPVSPAAARRNLLTFARDRQRRALLDDAQRLYEGVLRYHPNDAEARCGLAEVELLRGGVDDSAQLFARALRDNPGWAPAWVGLADIDWMRGQQARAACRYRAVIDRFPASSYPPYIVQRAATSSADAGANDCGN